MCPLQIDRRGLAFIRHFEGLRLQLYRDSAGKLTIGIGHLVRPGEDFQGGITVAQAYAMLRQDVQVAVRAVHRLVKVTLTQNQFDALVSFVYNLGAEEFAQSTLLRLLTEGKYQAAADQFPRWDHAAGKVVDGLLVRRRAERELFLRNVATTIQRAA